MQGNFNPMQVIQMLQGGANPQQLTMNILQSQLGNSPMGENLLKLAQGNQNQQLEQIARNIAQQKGVDFDKEFSAFMNLMKH